MPPRRSTRSRVGYEPLIVSAHRTPDRLYAFAKGARQEGFKVVIAGAGGAAHLPGMTASLTPLPVFGVPVKTTRAGGQGLASLHRADAGRHSGRHARHRQGRARSMPPCSPPPCWRCPTQALAKRLDAWRARQTAAIGKRPANERAARKRAEKSAAPERSREGCAGAETRRHHRHSRRRPARPHAGAGRGAARPALPRLCSDIEEPCGFDVAARATRRRLCRRGRARPLRRRVSMSSPTNSRTCRRRRRASLPRRKPVLPDPQGAGNDAGPADREGIHRRARRSRPRPTRRSHSATQLAAAIAQDRRARRAEDAPPRL